MIEVTKGEVQKARADVADRQILPIISDLLIENSRMSFGDKVKRINVPNISSHDFSSEFGLLHAHRDILRELSLTNATLPAIEAVAPESAVIIGTLLAKVRKLGFKF